MTKRGIDRRNFNRLTAAAFGGIVAGSIAGCGGKDDGDATQTGGDGPDNQDTTGNETGGDELAVNDWTSDTHVCRGLNACNNKGKSADNGCAGQGTCATTPAAPHTCHTLNDCKYQGGCGETVGNNSCKGKGECSVPLGEDSWKKAREAFEAAMKSADKTVGSAPEAS